MSWKEAYNKNKYYDSKEKEEQKAKAAEPKGWLKKYNESKKSEDPAIKSTSLQTTADTLSTLYSRLYSGLNTDTYRDPESAKTLQRTYDEYRNGITAMKNAGADVGDLYDSLDSIGNAVRQQNKFYAQFADANEYDQWKAYAKEIQKVTGQEDYEKYSKMGAEMKNPTFGEANKGIKVNLPFGIEIGKDPEIPNIVTYSRENADILAAKKMQGGAFEGNELYTELTDDEVNVYNYYIAKEKEGLLPSGTAQKYLDGLEDTITQRSAGKVYSQLEDKDGLEMAFGVIAGLDNMAQGLKNVPKQITASTEDIKPSTFQYVSGMVRQDLGERGEQFLGTDSTTPQAIYDAITTTSQMLPTIALSYWTGGLLGATGIVGSATAGTIGEIAGTAMLGASAGGNEYANLVQQGFNPDQARAISLVKGVWEGGSEFALGAVEGLGGNFIGKALDKTAFYTALKTSGSGLAYALMDFFTDASIEGMEEVVQDLGEKVIDGVMMGKWESVNGKEELYNFALGFLSAAALNGASTAANGVTSYRQGKNIINQGKVEELKNLAKNENLFDAQTVAYKIADKVNNKSGAFQVARLLHSVQGTLTEQTQSELSAKLIEKGMSDTDAQSISKWLTAAVDGELLNSQQKRILNENEVVSQVFREMIVDRNSTVNQRLQGLMDVQGIKDQAGTDLEALADYTSGENIARRYNTKTEFLDKVKRGSMFGTDQVQRSVRPDSMSERDAMVQSVIKQTRTAKESTLSDRVSDTGDTVSASTGRVLKIDGISSIEDGKMMLKTQDGTIDSSNVKFSTDAEATVYDTILSLGCTAEEGNMIISQMKGSPLDTRAFMSDVALAYKYGQTGQLKSLDSLSIPSELSKQIYNWGRKESFSTNQAKTEEARQRKVAPKATTKVTLLNDLESKYKNNKLNAKQKTDIMITDMIAKTSPLDIYMFESYERDGVNYANIDGNEIATTANGWFSDGNKIYLDIRSGNDYTGFGLFTLAHETGHYIRDWNASGWQTLADAVVNLIDTQAEKGKSPTFEQVLEDKLGKYKMMDKYKDMSETELYDMAYEDVICDSLSTLMADKKTFVQLANSIKVQDQTLWGKIKTAFENFIKKLDKALAAYKGVKTENYAGLAVQNATKQMRDQIRDLYVVAFTGANANLTYATQQTAAETATEKLETITEDVQVETTETTDPAEVVKNSYRSFAEACGFDAYEDQVFGVRYLRFKNTDHNVSKVTDDQIANSPIGAMISYSLDRGYITKEDYAKQIQMFTDIGNMCIKQQDFAQAMQFVGSMIFTGMKANADKQYGTTYDFPSICTKTQAMIDAMSAAMVKKKAGLTKDEIADIYRDVWEMGNPVPCPECYVFSRWIGIGGLLDNIKKYQDTYGKMSIPEVEKAYQKMKAQIEQYAVANDLTFGKAKGKLASKYTKEFDKLTDEIKKAGEAGNPVPDSKRKKLEKVTSQMETVKAMTWIDTVYFADANHTKVNPKYKVPVGVLFDLNNGEKFATEYKEAWAFRTTQGAGYGKAITPYAEAVLGEGILVTNNTTKTIKAKANRDTSVRNSNIFLEQYGTMSKDAAKILETARKKQLVQAFLGGQRFQSTSDARYENVTDYLIAAVEMQAMHGKVQVYTKVSGAVEAFNNWGFSINQSLMPLNSGLDENGKPIDTATGGMNPSVAFKNRDKFENAGTITIGVNDNHIRALFKEVVRDFIIPYHASGGDSNLISEFRRIQDSNLSKESYVPSCDYSKVQSEKLLPREVLAEMGYTQKQMDDVDKFRQQRLAILTGNGTVDKRYIRAKGNEVLANLYDEFNGGKWDGVKLTKGKCETQIYPNEYWDTSITYEQSGKITADYLEYCRRLGMLHKFSGLTVKFNKKLGKTELITVTGYDEFGNRVNLTDLAYKNGNESDGIEEFFWKVLVDRRMYGNDGKYLEQKFVTLGDADSSVAKTFAKDNSGSSREYSKAISDRTVEKVKKRFSDRDYFHTDEFQELVKDDSVIAALYTTIYSAEGYFNPKFFEILYKEHPELDYVERLQNKSDKTAVKDFTEFVDKINNAKTLEDIRWFVAEAHPHYNYTLSPSGYKQYDFTSSYKKTHMSGLKKFREIIDNRIKELNDVGGTKLNFKNNQRLTVAEVRDLYNQLNDYLEVKPIADKVFDLAEKLNIAVVVTDKGVDKRHSSIDSINGFWYGNASDETDKTGLVVYRTSYLNDPRWTDSEKANTLVHEMIHACTAYAINDANIWQGRYGDGRFDKAIEMLDNIYRKMRFDPKVNKEFLDKYASRSNRLHEFVAELLNPKFVDSMMRTSNKYAESYIEFLNAEAELLGIDKKQSVWKNSISILESMLDNFNENEYLGTAIARKYIKDKSVPRFSDRDLAPTFYSKLQKTVEKINVDKISTNNFDKFLLGKGVKEEEIKWSGIRTFLEGKKSVTKAELMDFLKANQLVISEKTLKDYDGGWTMSDKVIAQATEIGTSQGYDTTSVEITDYDDYREAYEVTFADGNSVYVNKKYTPDAVKWSEHKLVGGSNYREILFKMPNSDYTNRAMETHWEEPGVLAHARVQDFDTPNGDRVMFIEEIQSDWHNAGHKNGYITKVTDDNSLVMLIDGYYTLIVNGKAYNSISDKYAKEHWLIAPGSEKAFEAKIKEELINDFNKNEYDRGRVPDAPFSKNYTDYVLKNLLRQAAEGGYDYLAWTTGKMQEERWSEEYAEGYRIEYDQDIPKFLNKYGKQWSAKVGDIQINSLSPTTDISRDRYERELMEWNNSHGDMYTINDTGDSFSDFDDLESEIRNIVESQGYDWWKVEAEDYGDHFDYVADDKILARVTVNEQFPDYNSWAEDINHEEGSSPELAVVPAIPVTDSMKESVLYEGQPMFSDRDTATFDDLYDLAKDGDLEKFKGKSDGMSLTEFLVLASVNEVSKQERQKNYSKKLIDSSYASWLDDISKESIENFRAEWLKYTGDDITDLIELEGYFGDGKLGNFDSLFGGYGFDTLVYRYNLQSDKTIKRGSTDYNRLRNLYDIASINVSNFYKGLSPQLKTDAYNYSYEARQRRGSDLRYSDRDPSALDARTILSNALATTAQNDIEKKYISDYQENIGKMNGEQQRLTEIRARIKEISFGKGQRDMAELKRLKAEATKIENRIRVYDKKLLNLESASPLKSVVDREKARAKKMAEQAGKEALAAYKAQALDAQRKIRQKYREQTSKRMETNLRTRVKNYMEDFRQRLMNPTERRYIPAKLVEGIVSVYDAIDPTGADQETKSAQKYRTARQALNELKTQYDSLKEMDYEFSSEYMEEFSQNISALADAVGDTPLREMTRDQLEDVYTIMHDISAMIKDATKQIGTEESITNYAAGQQLINDMDAVIADNLTEGKVSTFFREQTLNPMRASREMAGYAPGSRLIKAFEALNEGRRKADDFRMKASKKFEELRKTKEGKDAYSNAVEEASIELMDTSGKYVKISKMQAMQALLTYERELANQGRSHLDTPVRFTDVALDVKGKYSEAFDKGHDIVVGRSFINTVEQSLNDWDRAYLKAAREFFNKESKDAVNQVSMVTKHRPVATENAYIPYKVNQDYISKESENVKFDASILNPGIMKSVKTNAHQQLVMRGLNSVIEEHMNKVADIYGLSIPVRNWNKMFNTKQTDKDGGRAVKAAIRDAWGDGGVKMLDQAVADLQSNRRSESHPLLNAIKSGFVVSTLASNLSVWMKQAASYPTAGAILSSGSLLKALPEFGKNLEDLYEEIDAHTSQHWIRRRGLSTQELGEMNQTHGWVNRVNSKLGNLSPMNWIQAMDVQTTAALWVACKYEIESMGISESDSNYWYEVTKLYDKVIEETQPMYDSLHRAEMTKNGALKNIILFQTQPIQNSGILREGAMELKMAKKKFGANSEEAAIAGRKFKMAVTSQLASHFTFTAMTLLGAMMLHKMNPYRDDDKELTSGSVGKEFGLQFAKNVFSAFVPIFGTYIVLGIEKVFGGSSYDVLSDPVVDKINTTFDNFSRLKDPSLDNFITVATDIASYWGIPAKNAYNILKGVALHIEDIANGEFLSFEAGVDRNLTQDIHRAMKAYEDGDVDTAKSIVNEMKQEYLDKGKTEKEAKQTVRSQVTRVIKPMFLEAYSKSDSYKMADYRRMLNETGLYDDVVETTQKWIKDSAKK